jgi:hypothetical protein
MAVGADYGLILFSGEEHKAFPFPQGARRETKDIQSMAWDGANLHVVSAKNAYVWDRKTTVRARPFPQDGTGGFEELRCVLAGPKGLIEAWRTRWVLGGESRPAEDILCLASDGNRVFYGSRDGQLGVLGEELLHRFPDQPIRHMVWAHQRLWIAAAGGLYSLGEGLEQVLDREPYGLCMDPYGRLWVLSAEGPALSESGETPRTLGLEIHRPWSIGANESGLWIGERGGLSRWSWAPESSAG